MVARIADGAAVGDGVPRSVGETDVAVAVLSTVDATVGAATAGVAVNRDAAHAPVEYQEVDDAAAAATVAAPAAADVVNSVLGFPGCAMNS